MKFTMKYAEALFNEHSEILALEDIYPSAHPAHPDFYQEVQEEIEDGGLAFPLVVVYSTVAHWRDIWVTSLIPVPEYLTDTRQVHWIACGNNRYHILDGMGVTHTDCIVVPDFKQANTYCWSQRKWQNDRHGRRTRGKPK